MRNARALGALSLLIASGAFAAAPASSLPQGAPWRLTDDVTFTRQLAEDQPWREVKLASVMKRFKHGYRFAPEELAILDAYLAGLPIATIEAEALASRVLLHRFVEGRELAPEQADILDRYLVYTKARARELGERTVQLNAHFGRVVQGADDSRDYELYSRPDLWNQLDGLQRTLERKYGRKGGFARLILKEEEAKARNPFSLPRLISAELSLAAPLAPIANTLVNDPTADTTASDTQSETSLVMGTSNVILASFNDSGSNFGGAAHFTGTSRSTDSGANWTDQGTLPNSANGDAGDPVFARSSSTGTVILATLGFNTGAALPIFRSTDNGVSWGAPVDGDGGGTDNDKEWVAADNFPGGAGVGQGNFYMFWRDFGGGGGMSFTRSTNDGVTWSARQVLAAGSGQGAQVAVGADHAVYAMWLAAGPALVVRKSTDQGVSFAPAVTAAAILSSGVNGDLGLGGGFRTSVFPQLVAHPTDPNQLYMVWPDNPAGADKADIFFAQTANGGATWSAPVRVNLDAGTNDQWQPVLAVKPDGTGLFVSWYDRRNDAGNTLFDVYARHAVIAGSLVTFEPIDYRVTDGSSPVIIGQDPVINTTYMGDYDQATADNSFYYRTWADNRLARLTHANQPDVRFMKVSAAGPGPLPVAGGTAQTAESCTPANGAPDPGETLTYTYTITNGGSAATTNLVGTLQVTGGVTSPSAPQTYGAIAPGASVTRSFTFVASGSCGGTVTPTLQLQDGATDFGTVNYPAMLLGTPSATNFTNAAAIAINDNAAATPYPSTINVSGVTTYSRVTLTLNLMSHTWPDDLDIILVSPGGQKAYVMSDNGTGTDIVNVNLTFDDTAAAALTNAAIVSGTYKPSNYQGNTTTDVMPAPAPAGPYAADFSGFTGLSGANLNGTWSLYVRDDVGSDTGSIAGGWTLTFVAPPVCSTSCAVASADLSVTNTPTSGGTVNAGSNITYSFVATNLGPDAADAVTLTTSTPANTTFVSASPSAGATLVAAPAVGGTGAVTYTWLGSTASAGTRTLGMVVNVNPGTPAATVIGSSVNASSTTGDPSGANNVQLSNVTVTAPVTAPPMLTSFTPSSGAVGTLVTLIGLNLSGTTDVKFNGTSAAFTPISATQVKATVPAGATTGPIAVTNALGTGTTAVKFTVLSSLPRIVTFSPTSGTTGTVVTISGANLAGTTAVMFNGTAAAFTQISATQVKATVPAGATTGPISVTTPFGTATTGTVKFTKF